MPSCVDHVMGSKPQRPCFAARMKGHERCFNHGEGRVRMRSRLSQPITIATGGGYDGEIYKLTSLPKHIADRLKRAREASDPMSLVEEMAIARARLSLLLDMAESGKAGASLAVPSLEKTLELIAKLIDTQSRVAQRTAQQLTQANVDAAIGVVLDRVLHHGGPDMLRKIVDDIARDLGVGPERRRTIMPAGMRPGDAAEAAAGVRVTAAPVAPFVSEDATRGAKVVTPPSDDDPAGDE